MKYAFTIIGILLFTLSVQCQYLPYAKSVVDTLTSPLFWGRGYTNNGMHKAAKYIATQMKALGLQPIKQSSYFQTFNYPVNTFPGKVSLVINGDTLLPGKDFIIAPESKGIHQTGSLQQRDSTHFYDPVHRVSFTLQSKLTWSVATSVAASTQATIISSSLKNAPQHYAINVSNAFRKNFKASNVCGMVRGTTYPDSFMVFTAHYDHLGGMGKRIYFAGANDNASGIAMLLSLASYYVAHPQPYSVAFVFFAGEEAGLLGSKYFTDHPLLPLQNINFLINLDLVGTGDDGITVVNASTFPQQYAKLLAINKSQHFVPNINARGKAANSDHFWFSELGVPSIFIYTLGGIKAYHDVDDVAVTLPLTAFDKLVKLIIAFTAKNME